MQEAFRENHGLQCGFCTPGMIMTAVDLVHRKGHDLSDHTIREELEATCAAAPAIRTSSSRSRPAPRRWRTPISRNARHRTGGQEYLMYDQYHRPATVRQAANLLVKNEDAR